MSFNLLKAGYELTVYDINTQTVEALVEAGAKAGTPTEMGETCDVIITMLPASHHVKQVVLGENGILETATEGTTILEHQSMFVLIIFMKALL